MWRNYDMRGYFGIGIENCKKNVNLGSLWRSAQAFEAGFIFVIGSRYKTQKSDTCKAYRSIPLYEYATFNQFYNNRPKDCMLIGVEYPHEKAKSLFGFCHPERAIYLLGSEDKGLSSEALLCCDYVVKVDSKICLNVSTCGSIILYDRLYKGQNSVRNTSRP